MIAWIHTQAKNTRNLLLAILFRDVIRFHLKRGNVEGDVRRRSRALSAQGCVLAGKKLHSQWEEPPGLRVQHLQHQPHLCQQES